MRASHFSMVELGGENSTAMPSTEAIDKAIQILLDSIEEVTKRQSRFVVY